MTTSDLNFLFITTNLNPPHLQSGVSLGPTKHLLSESLEFENFEERRLMEIMHMQHEPLKPQKSPVAYR